MMFVWLNCVHHLWALQAKRDNVHQSCCVSVVRSMSFNYSKNGQTLIKCLEHFPSDEVQRMRFIKQDALKEMDRMWCIDDSLRWWDAWVARKRMWWKYTMHIMRCKNVWHSICNIKGAAMNKIHRKMELYSTISSSSFSSQIWKILNRLTQSHSALSNSPGNWTSGNTTKELLYALI